MSRILEVYLSVLSPWAHLGHAPFLELAARHGLAPVWRPVHLPGLFSETGGLPLAQRAIQRQRYRFVELQRWAEARGRPIHLRPKHWPFDATLADAAALALIARGEDPAPYLGAAMRGVWEEERDLASRDTIADVLAEQGFDADAVMAEAARPETAAAYALNRAKATDAGVFGSPAYVLDGEVFWGQDRLEMLDQALASGRAPYTPDF
ncbi:2-hydroxychromene-2-carboxylate isomerase [Methylopila sp. Yamaguchi]|uniref:2-hydroxychromene-2-carboxylate isomerase n=1 Tax=Methylopila sp. Yamaguchi TaxID=1437817 RepID=UPI000CB5A206|nr:2-hydroxychromene-2-carboxylate isomerase [Methylopila sp. Yamaguchi]GBD49160.1 DSBA oxidoreductase [Methylopila sp. Yamaguchi]